MAQIDPIFSLIDPDFKFTQTKGFWIPSINFGLKSDAINTTLDFDKILQFMMHVQSYSLSIVEKSSKA